MKNILIIDCSPKQTGNTSYLVNAFKQNTSCNITHVRLFPQINQKDGILPCMDCGGCSRQDRCVVNDCFNTIIADVYDIVFIASPIYMSNLPGPALNLISRFNYIYNNKIHLNVTHNMHPKRGILLLVGGGFGSKLLQGESNEDIPIKQANYIFRKLNTTLNKNDIITCLNTDFVKVKDNAEVLEKIIDIAKSTDEFNWEQV